MRSLEDFIGSVISDQLTAMLDGADEALFDMAEKASGEADKRLYFDVLRVLRVERARLVRSFQDNLKHSFADGRSDRAAASIDLDDMDSWSVQGAEDTEETVTIANLESKVSSLYQKDLSELEQRLEHFADKTGDAIKVSSKLAAPAKIFDALRHTMKGLAVDYPIKQVIYRLAERSLIDNLGPAYSGANRLLAERGYLPVGSRRSSAAPRTSAVTPAADVAPEMTLPTGAAAWPSGLSASRLLEGLAPHRGSALSGGGTADGAGTVTGGTYNDAQLAGEIGAVLDALAQGRPHRSGLPAANLALSGQMFDSLYQDRALPDPLRPLLRRLQYPVMKTALADAAFFSNSRHPVRRLVHEIYDLLSSTDHPDAQDVTRLSDLIDYLLSQFEIPSQRLSRAEDRAPVVNEEHAAQFLTEQKQRLEEHRTRAVERVRRVVAQELKLRTAARRVPPSLMPLLLSGFAPLLSVNAVRGGIDGIPWNDSLGLLDRLLNSIEPQAAERENQGAEEAEIVARITERLIGIGLPHDKVQRLVGLLLDHYQSQALHHAQQAEAAPSAAELAAAESAGAADRARHALSAVLTVGGWFQVWDASSAQRRWLKLGAYVPERNSVSFDDFLGENRLRIPASSLIRDLVEGRSTPVDPSPAVQRSLSLLAPLLDLLPESQEAPLWQPASPSTH